MGTSDASCASAVGGASFPATQWSVVLAAGDGSAEGCEAALADLCRKYWYPLYSYVRRQGYRPEDAQDLTQEFFARFLEKRYLGLADPQRGRFRSFLLTSLKHFLINEWESARAAKRGGGSAPISLNAQQAETRYRSETADGLTPEKAYERRWAVTLLEEVLAALRREYTAEGKASQFELLRTFLWGTDGTVRYEDIASRLGTTQGAIKVSVHRLRLRYRELLRNEIARTVQTAAEVEDEVRFLFSAFA